MQSHDPPPSPLDDSLEAREPGATDGDPPSREGHGESETRRHLRGSSLLLAGRLIALLINFLVQVLTVRYLAKVDYGAFAYALAVVSMATSANLLGLHRAVNRFVPLYHERRDYGSMLGTVLLSVGAIVGVGLAIAVLTFGLRGVLASSVVSNPLSVGLLLILIALSPLQALDSVFQGVVAALASPGAIFFRRHVLGPGLRLAAVLLVLLVQGSVELLAVCYLVAGLLGVAIYGVVIYRLVREQGLLTGLRQRLRLPAGDIFRFGLPLMTTDLVLVLKTTMAVVILEHFRGSAGVADFRAVVPVAGLNLVVLQSIKLLFTPAATRLFAREDASGMNDLYWRSAIWTTIVTFPVFAVCVFLAEPVTAFLFGARYAASEGSPAATVLAILAIGNYFNASMGLNTYTLQVYARVRFITTINAIVTTVALALSLALIPGLGAVGAAAATAGSTVAHNLLNHAGLLRWTDVRVFERHRWKPYLTVLVAVLALALVDAFLAPPLPVTAIMVIMVAIAWFVLLGVNRDALRLLETFPELGRVPILGRLLAPGGRR